MADTSGILDEHSARGDDASVESKDAIYSPTEDDKKAIKLAEKIYERNKRHRSQYDGPWLDYYNMFRGKQWKEQRPSYRHSEVINLIFRALQSSIPIQLDTHPKFEYLPQSPADQEFSDLMNMVAEASWIKNNWGEQLLEIVWDSNLMGTGMSAMLVKESLGRSKICWNSADPFYCFPDPEARDVNKDSTVMGYSEQAATFCYAEPMDVRKIKKKYPAVKDFIKSDVQDLMNASKTDTQPLRWRSPIDQKVVMEGGGTNSFDALNKEKALLVTTYLSAEWCEDDFEEVRQDSVDPETGHPNPPEFVQKARFPNGRKIVTCNGVLCENVDNGYDDGMFPFDRYPNYTLPREFWGISEVEQLSGPQKTFNKLVSFVLDVLTLMGNPVWLIPTSTGIDPENLINKPGLNIEFDGDKPPERLPGVQLQPYVMEIIDKMAQWFDTIGGSQDITRGVQPTGVTAASAISTLQESAQTRIRQKTRNMDFFLQGVGTKFASRVMQFMTVPEIFRLTDSEGASKYFQMHVETKDETGNPYQDEHGNQLYTVKYQPFTEEGQVDPSQLKVFQTRGQLDVKVSTGSSLPFAKDQLENKLLAFFDRGIIDAEEVLKRSDYPNRESVLNRIQQKAAQDAQAAAAQGQAGAAPPPAA